MIINERFKVVFFRVGCVCVREGGGEIIIVFLELSQNFYIINLF